MNHAALAVALGLSFGLAFPASCQNEQSLTESTLGSGWLSHYSNPFY